jgi:hypothetical protein
VPPTRNLRRPHLSNTSIYIRPIRRCPRTMLPLRETRYPCLTGSWNTSSDFATSPTLTLRTLTPCSANLHCSTEPAMRVAVAVTVPRIAPKRRPCQHQDTRMLIPGTLWLDASQSPPSYTSLILRFRTWYQTRRIPAFRCSLRPHQSSPVNIPSFSVTTHYPRFCIKLLQGRRLRVRPYTIGTLPLNNRNDLVMQKTVA